MNIKKLFITLFVILGVGSAVAQQPYSPCWHPDNIKNWKPSDDQDAKFNRSRVPLQPRFWDNTVKANSSQFADSRVAACLTMNPECSLTPSQDADNILGYNPTYWQYMDLLIWWGGSAGEGIIIPPSAPVVDVAHMNGVKVLGQLFFPPRAFSGDPAWLRQMLTKEGGEYPYARKLYEIADYYGFDGWFINEELHGALPGDWMGFIETFNKCKKAGGKEYMEIQWYNNDIVVGDYMDMVKMDGVSYFLDYGSNTVSNIQSQMQAVKNAGMADIAFSKLYFGIESAINGFTGNADKFSNLFTSTGHRGSPNIFNPEEGIWKKVVDEFRKNPVNGSAEQYKKMQEVFQNESRFWTNAKGDPSDNSAWGSSTWPGLANTILERSVIQTKPFVTTFGAGLGKKRFVNGEEKGNHDWYHRGMQTIMPTWRWWFDNKTLSADIYLDDAYNMGTSVKVSGALSADADHIMRLYKTRLAIASGDKIQLVYKGSGAVIDAKLGISENANEFATVTLNTVSTNNGWTVAEGDLSFLNGKTVSIIALNFRSSSNLSSYEVLLGQLAVYPQGYYPELARVENLKIENKLAANSGDIRVVWDAPKSEDIDHYNIYLQRNGVKSLVGQTRDEGFYIPKFNRSSDSETGVTVSVTAVVKDMREGAEVSASVNYRDLAAPEVVLSASQTLIPVNGTVTLYAKTEDNPTGYEWILPPSARKTGNGGQISVQFTQAGVFDIGVKVTNKAGTTEITEKAFVEVANNADDLKVVSVDKQIHSVSGQLAGEEAYHLIDGVTKNFSDVHQKWCIGGKKEHWVVVDLQESYKLYKFRIIDCKQGEPEFDNISMYKIYVSNDAVDWTLIADERSNPATEKTIWVKPTIARYVKFVPYSTEPVTIRIWEFEAYGVATKLTLDKSENLLLGLGESAEKEFSYGFGGTEKEENFNIEVKTDRPDLLEIKNIRHDEVKNKISFDMLSLEIGTAEVEVSIKNGDWVKSSVFEVKIEDLSLINIARGALPSIVMKDAMSVIPNEPNLKPENALTDGNRSTFWAGWKTFSVKIDLGKIYDARVIKFMFEPADYNVVGNRCYFPSEVKVYTAQTDEESAYASVAWFENKNLQEINEVVLPVDGRQVRYVRLEVTGYDERRVFLQEIEVLAKTDKENPLLIGNVNGVKIEVGKSVKKKIPVDLGDMSVEDNLEVVSRLKSVSGSDVAIVNASYDEDARKILLDIEGKTPGNADLVVALKNGDWQVCTNLSVVVFSGGNLALGKSITESHVSATGTPLSGGGKADVKTLVDGIKPIKGDGSADFNNLWCGPSWQNNTKSTVVIDLESEASISDIKVFGAVLWSTVSVPGEVKIFIGSEDSESSYQEVYTWKRSSEYETPNKYRHMEFDYHLPSPMTGRYVKLQLTQNNEYDMAVALREIEVYGESSSDGETPSNTLSVSPIEAVTLNGGESKTLETSYSLGGASQKENFDISVSAQDGNIVKVSKVMYDEVQQKITFELRGLKKGTTGVRIVFENGKWSTSSDVNVSVLSDDPLLGIENVKTVACKVYPNPVRKGGVLVIEAEQIRMVKILTLQGSLLREVAVESDRCELNMGYLSSGVYLLIIDTENDMKVQKVTVK